MHTSALEEVALTEHINEQELQPGASETIFSPEPETQEQEVTALIPTEPDVIEGEVIEVQPLEYAEDRIPPKQNPYWLLIPFTILMCLSILAISLVQPLVNPSAIVTLVPVERSLSITTSIQVPGRSVAPLTLSQSTSIATTGKRHQKATRAHGTIRLYNGLLSGQTIAAGTMLTGRDGVQVVTDQPASLPAAIPPLEGQVTISAHARIPGAQGNIQAFDINQACCAPSVLAKNTQAFTEGQSARAYLVVTKADMQNAVASLQATLAQSEQAALQAQLKPGETLIMPPCSQQIQSDHQVGEEANEVTLTVAETCSAVASDTQALHQQATQMLTQEAVKRFGTGYRLLGDIAIQVAHATITDYTREMATIAMNLAATFVYQLTPGERQHLSGLIAGQSTQHAMTTLLQVPGIQGVHINSTDSAHQTLPADPTHIQIILLYSSTP
jgi:hypothetical protein